MKAKIIPPDKMHLIEAFTAAQKAEAKVLAGIEKLKDGGVSISEELIELSLAAQRRTIDALTAIQNLP